MIPEPEVSGEEATESCLLDFTADPKTFRSLLYPETSAMVYPAVQVGPTPPSSRISRVFSTRPWVPALTQLCRHGHLHQPGGRGLQGSLLLLSSDMLMALC